MLLVVAVLGAWASWQVSQLGFDYEFEQLFPTGHHETVFFKAHQAAFGHDNDFILIALEAGPDTRTASVWDTSYWAKSDALTVGLLGLPHVLNVNSPTRIELPIGDPVLGAVFKRRLIRWDEPQALGADSAQVSERPHVLGNLISQDHSAAALLIEHDMGLSKAGCDTLSRAVQALLDDIPLRAHVAGRATSQIHIIEVLGEEIVKFTLIGWLLIIVLLWIAFRSWWGIAIPMAVVLLGVIGTLAALESSGYGIDLMTVVMPTILFVVGISDTVHISTRFKDELRDGKAPYAALRTTFRDVGLATFTTSITTAIGFLTLWVSPIAPIQRFGLFSAFGVLLAFALAFTVLPSILILSKRSPRDFFQSRSTWRKLLDRLLSWSLRWRRILPWAALAITLAAALAASGLHANQKLLQDLRESDPIQQDFRYFESHFSGVRPYELAYVLHDSTWRTQPKIWAAMDSIEGYLREHVGVKSIQSPVTTLKHAYRLRQRDRPSAYVLPPTNRLETMARRWVREQDGMLQLSGRVADIGSLEMTLRNDDLQRYVDGLLKREFAEAPFGVHVTGTAHLIDVANRELARDMFFGLLIAFLAVALIAGLMFRSGQLVAIALWVNILPILLVAALMRILGIDLNLSTSMLFTIAFGIAVDDTLHMLSHFRIMLKRGHAPAFAVRRTMHRAGKAVIITSAILIAGFMTLATSQLIGPAQIGWLLAFVLAAAVIIDLTLLPLLLLWWAKRWKPT